MTDKIAIERKILEHTVIALEYAYGTDDVLIAESIKFLRHALAGPPSMQPLPNHDNHHNALKCPYCNPRGLVFAEPQEEKQALQKIADFGQDQERPAPSQAKSLALLDIDCVEHMQGGANGPTIRLRGFINAQTGPTAPQPPIDNAFVAEGCEQFSTPTEPAEPVAWIGLPGKGTPLYAAQPAPAAVPSKLWLWKNFVDGRPEYWAFDNPFPIHMDYGDPQTLGEPCGYAIFKPSRQGRTDVGEAEVLRRIAAAKKAA